ncbi:MAG: DUF433 domain-containing protein [Cyanobacteria bacterium P01_A01_bin.123]
MNVKLVESLVQAVESLPPEDYALFQDVLLEKIVRQTSGVAGGHACIRDTRIALWTLISLINQGADEAELARDFPGLTRFDFWWPRLITGLIKTKLMPSLPLMPMRTR